MSDFSLQLVISRDTIDQYWPEIFPLFDRWHSEDPHRDVTAADIKDKAMAGMCFIFVGLEYGRVIIAMALEAVMLAADKGARVIALCGERLFTMKARYWKIITDWLLLNDMVFVDALVSPQFANILQKRLKFSTPYHYVRLPLREVKNVT